MKLHFWWLLCQMFEFFKLFYCTLSQFFFYYHQKKKWQLYVTSLSSKSFIINLYFVTNLQGMYSLFLSETTETNKRTVLYFKKKLLVVLLLLFTFLHKDRSWGGTGSVISSFHERCILGVSPPTCCQTAQNSYSLTNYQSSHKSLYLMYDRIALVGCLF